MNVAGYILLVIVIWLFVEMLSRIHYYGRKREYPVLTRIKLIFFGKWLISDAKSSPLYLNEVANALGVDRDYMLDVLGKASGKDAGYLAEVFSQRSGTIEDFDYNPLLGFLPAPNQNLYHLHTNRQGFRGRDTLYHKPPNTKRVVLLGGSVAYGRTATSDELTIASQLEDILNAGVPPESDTRWEVISLAAPDLISFQEIAILLKIGMRYDPDYVISFSGFNDAHHYLLTGEQNESASLRRVPAAYHAFFGKPLWRILMFLGSFFVSFFYFAEILQRSSRESEELSPYIYTIW